MKARGSYSPALMQADAAPSRSIARWLLVAYVLSACGSEPVPFERTDAFYGHSGERSEYAFDAVAADMDEDGDADLLVNWHHLGPLELFENVGGAFELKNSHGNDRSGLDDDRGIPSLFASTDAMLEHLAGSAPVGLYVWHDVDRRGRWFLWWQGSADTVDGFRVEASTSLGIVAVDGLEEDEIVRRTRRKLSVEVARSQESFLFSLRTHRVTVRLGLELTASDGSPLPIYVGAELAAFPGGVLSAWKPDPHGMAWVDVQGTRRPELFVTRGGLTGLLRPPMEPKEDRFYLSDPQTASDGPLYRRAPWGVVPPDHARGRRVEWVDIDTDGRLELSISCKDTPNRLLARDPVEGVFRDVASDCGLDLVGAAVQCWMDLDDDGLQDLFLVDERTIHVRRNLGGRRFEAIDGASLGLSVHAGEEPAEELFDPAALRPADVDGDGRLDLLLTGFGTGFSSHLFLRTDQGFVDATRRFGLAEARGSHLVLLLDIDDDGFLDAVGITAPMTNQGSSEEGERSGAVVLWRNHRGETFDFQPLSDIHEPIYAGTVLDADRDGRRDLVLIGTRRHLLHNVSKTNASVALVLRDPKGEPIGAVVRLTLSDGTTRSQRYGSARSSAFSQVLGPLFFGIPDGTHPVELSVLWPGDPTARRHEIPELGQTTVVERQPH